MNTYGMDLMGRRRRRRHSSEFKAAVVRECMHPGVSIAAVALAHSLNANHRRLEVATVRAGRGNRGMF
jgi:transposase